MVIGVAILCEAGMQKKMLETAGLWQQTVSCALDVSASHSMMERRHSNKISLENC